LHFKFNMLQLYYDHAGVHFTRGRQMNLYEAIFVRKSVRNYVFEPLSEDLLREIRTHYAELPNLFGDYETDISIYDNTRHTLHIRQFHTVKAPYYMLFYSRESARCQMNMGYLMQQMNLFLCCKGLGACFVGSTAVSASLQQKRDMRLIGILAFGKSKESPVRKKGEARRLPLEELCVFKEVPRAWMRQLLEAARFAPSSMNIQPWRFVVFDDRIHVFTKKHKADHLEKYRWEEVNFGIMFANIMITADELWLDVDLIRLENISQKSFPNNQYILSAIMKS